MTMTINPKNGSEHKGNLKVGKDGLPWGHYKKGLRVGHNGLGSKDNLSSMVTRVQSRVVNHPAWPVIHISMPQTLNDST